MKPTIICLCILLMAGFSFSYQEQAEETPEYGWKNGVVGGLNLMQTSFSNWQQGGENSFSFQLNLNAIFENDRENFNWKNTGKITYGNVKVGDQDMRKSIDEIKVESVFTYKMAKILNPFLPPRVKPRSQKDTSTMTLKRWPSQIFLIRLTSGKVLE